MSVLEKGRLGHEVKTQPGLPDWGAPPPPCAAQEEQSGLSFIENGFNGVELWPTPGLERLEIPVVAVSVTKKT